MKKPWSTHSERRKNKGWRTYEGKQLELKDDKREESKLLEARERQMKE